MLAWLLWRSKELGGARVIFAYETSGQGFVLCDAVKSVGFECYVLATTRMKKSAKDRRNKNDDQDAQRILQTLRDHFLAADDLPAIWVPDAETRLDREVVRGRLDLGEAVTKAKELIVSLLDRNGLEKPAGLGSNWTHKHRAWLDELTGSARVDWRLRATLASLLARLAAVETEEAYLDEHVAAVAASERNAAAVKKMDETKGVGLLVAIGVLLEMGDPGRFRNRRQVGSYTGLTASSHESGEADDRKGHITRQGPRRLRRLLAQAVQAWVRWDPVAAEAYRRLVGKHPKRKRIAKVAMMRRLGIRLWHAARDARDPSAAEAAATAQAETS
jgi:transposase